jgi:hypothetical protein
VVIATASTTAVEAVLLGRQVIQLGDGTAISAGDRSEDLPLFRYGCSTLVQRLEDLPAVIRSVVGSPGREVMAAARRVFVPPGRGAVAIAEVMEQLAG